MRKPLTKLEKELIYTLWIVSEHVEGFCPEDEHCVEKIGRPIAAKLIRRIAGAEHTKLRKAMLKRAGVAS